MKKSLVSIVTPCFNGEGTIGRLIESILLQTYRPLEYIFVDDGSTDDSLRIVESYRSRLSDAGISLVVHHQENQGLGGAISAGLKYVTGEYLCWPDADDYLEPESISKRVQAFREHPDVAVVTSNAYIRDADNLEKKAIAYEKNKKIHRNPKQFLYHLNAESIFCPGCHMVKTDIFFSVNPDKSIFPARRGQNWQMLLPLYFKYDRYFLDEPLYNYIVYPNSMSRGDDTYEKKLNRYNEHEEILRRCLKKIQDVQKVDVSEYSRFLDDKYAKLRMVLALQYKKKTEFNEEYRRKQISVGLDFGDWVYYVQNRRPVLGKALGLIWRLCGGGAI